MRYQFGQRRLRILQLRMSESRTGANQVIVADLNGDGKLDNVACPEEFQSGYSPLEE